MTVRLRKLEEKDAPFMMEWMHDPTINCYFRFNASEMTLERCLDFIRNPDGNIHFAIVGDDDEYLGTVSLKNVTEKDAEYAISTRKKAHGTGTAMQATKMIIDYAFNDLELDRVYLNVLPENKRANAFYIKAGFNFWYLEKDAVEIKGEKKDLNWYYLNRKDI